MRVEWQDGSQGEANGYAVVASQMRLALERAGAKMVEPLAACDVHVAVGLPDPSLLATGWMLTKQVWHTMLEVDILPANWAYMLNRCGLVWVPSSWVRDMFRSNGVTAPIVVSGYGVDPKTFHANGRAGQANQPMRFGVWSDALRTRKHPELAVAAWLAADVQDATLEVRLTDTTAAPFWVHEGREMRGVRVFRGPWSRERLADWLRSLDCLIYLSGGEGFGLMPFEAMACGTPVICAYNTGMMDYLTDDNAVLVKKHGKEPAWTYTAHFGPDYLPQQLLPDFDEAVNAIRWAADHRDGLLPTIGKRAAQDVGRMTWQAAGENLYGLLQNHMGVAA